MSAVVVNIARGRDLELVTVLSHFLDVARSGRLRSVMLCAADSSGGEEIAIAGDYRIQPDRAVAAAMRMSWRLTQMQDT